MNVGELTLDDALALLAAVDSDSDTQQKSTNEHSSSSSTSSSSGDCSPLLTGDELKLALWSSSEFSWSDPDDGDVVDLFFPSPSSESPISDSSHSDGSAGSDPQAQQLASFEASTTAAPRPASRQQKPTAKKLPPSQQPQPVHRRKRKAALSSRCGATAGDTESERGRQPKSAKTELLELREVAVELQLRLAQLQRRRTRSEPSASHSTAAVASLTLPMASTGWLESAMDEFKALQKAEELNATLKAEVHRQTGLSKNLQVLFTKKVAQQVRADTGN